MIRAKIRHRCLEYIGHEAVFYIPKYKLTTCIDAPGVLSLNALGRPTVEMHIHEFLAKNYNAYTVADSTITGLWKSEKDNRVFKDTNVEYRVAYEGRGRVLHFVEFLSNLCRELNEEAIYLKMGYKSYIVTPA